MEQYKNVSMVCALKRMNHRTLMHRLSEYFNAQVPNITNTHRKYRKDEWF